MCLPCDHSGYGDYGCQGNCTIGSLSDKFPLTCDEFGCKPGFYSLLKKTCINCNSEFCFKCGQQFHQRRNYNCYICGENFGQRYVILNSNGVSCCKCSRYSDFNKKFSCNNCNSEFCFSCGKN